MCVEQIYVRKVKLFLTYIPNISSEIVDFQENGGVGDIQTQIPYFPLYIGIAAWCSGQKIILGLLCF